MRKSKAIKNNGTYIFADFSNGLYLLDTPRGLGEQLASLALVGGRNVWSEKGALTSQYGYIESGNFPIEDVVNGYTKTLPGNNTMFITTMTGKVYLYVAGQGLKEYKTPIPVSQSDAITTRRGKDLILTIDGVNLLYGDYYEDSEIVELIPSIELLDFTSYHQMVVGEQYIKYFWTNKTVCVDRQYKFVVTSITKIVGTDNYMVRMVSLDEAPVLGARVTVGERCSMPIYFTWQPDNTGVEPPKPNVQIFPQLMEVSNNRLFIVDTSGRVYYSQIGVINSFDEKTGAGYLENFYNDTSKTLAIEDYMSATIIVKENGIYAITIGDTVSVKKISNVGQQYPSDHVIVGDKIYAYDTLSGSIVNAVLVNVFGNMVAGKVMVPGEYLNNKDLEINSSKRFLTWCAENNTFIMYYGEGLNKGLVYTEVGTVFPRELNKQMIGFVGFNQGVIGITQDNHLIQDFKRGTIIPELTSVAAFEPIGLRDNRCICSTILEVTELNGVDYTLTTENAMPSYQVIKPSFNMGANGLSLPPFLYSMKDAIVNSFELLTKWAEKTSNVTRVSAPMSGRNGVSLTFEFPANEQFCLAALRLPDFSQGN